MKKNYFIAIVMASAMTAIISSCTDDDFDSVKNATETTQKNIAKNILGGQFKSIGVDPVTGKHFSLDVSDNKVTVYSIGENGIEEQKSVEAQIDGDETVLKGHLSGFCGMNDFTLSKVGDFYYGLETSNLDGSASVLGFVASDNYATQDKTTEMLKSTATKIFKKAIGALLSKIPTGGIWSETIIDLICPEGEKESDMSVADCYLKLNEAMAALGSKIEDQNYKNVLYDHNTNWSNLNTQTNNCLAAIASIYTQLDNKEIDEQKAKENVEAKVKAWANTGYAKAAADFINEVHNGYGAGLGTSSPWYQVVDDFAEHYFPWEHEGYNFREMYRLRDVTTCVESALLLSMYKDMENGYDQYDASILKNIVETYNKNQVVKDNCHFICQIKGANHIKIDPKSFKELPLSHYDWKVGFPYFHGVSHSIFDNGNYNMDLDWYIFSDETIRQKAMNEGLPHDQKEWKEAAGIMLSESEAKAIYDYYGGKKTMRQIFMEELGMKCWDADYNQETDVERERDDVMFVMGPHTKVIYEDEIKHLNVERSCHLNRTNDTWRGVWFGDFHLKITYNSSCNETFYVFPGWEKRNTKIHFYRVDVVERTDGWVPTYDKKNK